MNQYRKINASKDKFSKVAHILESLIQKNINKKGFGDTNLLFRWNDIVGKEISEVTRPLRINVSKDTNGAILKLQVNRAYAPQISLCLDQIKAKVNQFFGYRAISEIVLQQRGPYSFKGMNKENDFTKK